MHDYAESKPAAMRRCLPLLTVFAFKLGGTVLVYASFGLFPAHVLSITCVCLCNCVPLTV